ncbi:hypothetical protein SAMN05216251_108246 [Actinacidiphila alni]|uniref:Uncharacterized protein n=1 Tax=Actinacidiphila alni TaxID=380248 RepID=A0A1I2G4V3_9ACTN|nr:hypothetical protein SAMN05216251_108246 [Actinacidiphila alni]
MRRPPPCQTPEARHSLTRARFYPAGWLCDRHSPWARLGLPKPQPGPGWPNPRPGVVRRRDDNRPITTHRKDT